MAVRKVKGTAEKAKPAKSKPAVKRGRKPARKSGAKPKKSASSKRKTSSKAAGKPIAVATKTFQLPERFDSAATAGVLESFKHHRGNALTVDASAVRRLGAQGFQILLSATRTWASDGHALRIENPSAEFVDAAFLLGLSHSELSISGSLQ